MNSGISFGSSQIYADSSLRLWLNENALWGFSKEVLGSMKMQSFPSNGEILNDKMKLPSLTEVGCHNTSDWGTDCALHEGTIYPIFGNKQSRPNALAIRTDPNGNGQYYWTRSRVTNDSSKIWFIMNEGSCFYTTNKSISTIGCVRFSKDPILKELSKPNPIEILKSGRITKDHIGFPVTLTNTSIDCQEWIIADVNHDDTIGTVDLISRTVFYRSQNTQFSSSGNEYSSSNLRRTINRAYNGFDENVKNAIITQSFPSNGEILNDKIKCPSITELGCYYDGYSDRALVEGSIYPLFGTRQQRDNIATEILISADSDGHRFYYSYWTRSRDIKYNNQAFLCGGRANSYYATESESIVGIIRF